VKKNKFLAAVLNLVLLSGVIHMVILIIDSIIKLDMSRFNFFDIVDLDLFFPNIAHGPISQILSTLIAVSIIVFFYRLSLKTEK